MRLLLALLFLAASSLAQDPVRIALPETGPPAAVTYWYGVYLADTKVGWVHVVTGRTKDGALVEEVRFEAKFSALGKGIDFSLRQRFEFEPKPPYALARATAEMTGETEQKVTIERAGKGYRTVFSSPGGDLRRDVPDLDYTYEDAWTQMEFFRRGPKKGDALVARTLDVAEARVDLDTSHVDEVEDIVVHGVKTRCYRGRTVSSVDGETGTYATLANGDPVELTFADLFEARLEDEETAKKIERSGDLFAMGMVPIDRKIGEATGVTTLVLEVTGVAAPRIAAASRQAVEARDDGVRVLKVGVASEAPATDAEIKDALAATTEYPVQDERVAALARKAVGDAKTPAEKVRRLVQFVSDYVEDDLTEADASGALDVIAARRGDCTEHSILFTALARAAGIPARAVSGLMYMGDEAQAFGGHAWNEVALDGNWVPVDPTWNQVEVDGTHIKVGHGDEGATAHLWVLGRLEFKLVSVERKP